MEFSINNNSIKYPYQVGSYVFYCLSNTKLWEEKKSIIFYFITKILQRDKKKGTFRQRIVLFMDVKNDHNNIK